MPKEAAEPVEDVESPSSDPSPPQIEILTDVPPRTERSVPPVDSAEVAVADEVVEDAGNPDASEGDDPGDDPGAEADVDGQPESKPAPRSRRRPPVPECLPRQTLGARIEALLIASDRPLSDRRLCDLVGLGGDGATARIREALAELDAIYRATGRAFRARRLAGGWQLVTMPAFGPLMERLHVDRQASRLSPAALETLAIVAYRQPVVRAELEAIRGVACGEVLRSLLERQLVTIVGRADELGRPMLYGTTRHFLEIFGLGGLDELPAVEGLERRINRRTTADRRKNETDAESAASAETSEAQGPAESPAAAGTDAPDSVDDVAAAPKGSDDAELGGPAGHGLGADSGDDLAVAQSVAEESRS